MRNHSHNVSNVHAQTKTHKIVSQGAGIGEGKECNPRPPHDPFKRLTLAVCACDSVIHSPAPASPPLFFLSLSAPEPLLLVFTDRRVETK
jgi:hypothetical protein